MRTPRGSHGGWAILALAAGACAAWADQPSAASQQPSEPEAPIQEVTVTAARLNLIGTAVTGSQGVVVGDELALTPAFRPGELLETVPGLSVTAHSGEGKANQYMMRGFDLDHGTDLAVFVDAMPVNEPTHAHGQGYSDLNFMIPELANNVTYTKGTYYPEEGDFASVGSVHVSYRDTIEDQVGGTAGEYGFQRVLGAGSGALGGGNLLGALELQHYDGPWASPDDQRKVNAVLRYSRGGVREGFSITGMFYRALWNSTTDQPERAIAAGLIGRFGSLDPSDGGKAQRESLSAQYRGPLGGGRFAASAYVIGNSLTLWNDFTHFLIDPVNGDQEAQHEDRATLGADARFEWSQDIARVHNGFAVGLRARHDINDIARLPTEDRRFLSPAALAAADYPPNFSEIDHVHLTSVAAYFEATTDWTAWMRSVLGLREDYQHGIDAGTNRGTAADSIAEPKGSLIFTPVDTTEIYLSWGRGLHSDDLRGVTQARSAGVAGAPLIASQSGEEVGLRQQFMRSVALTLAVYSLDAQSETTYDPDVGQDSAGPASRRYGAEVNITWEAASWLEVYGSYSANHARFRTPYDDGTGHVGEYLPNAPFASGSLNIYIKDLGPWRGGLQYRYVSGFPLSSDNEVQGHGYGEWDGDVHYALRSGWAFGLALFNILNERANAAEFWYVDRLPGEPAEGVPDVHIHPLEPRALRVTVAKMFD
ncbi:MAG TPA: TonB-dependent receptor plug domain-containing protein [Steroidobacteraceae bacterium]|nr:TonB-dependent receptor plug domain-containing protein [Steroidobacteraceae bacterium]